MLFMEALELMKNRKFVTRPSMKDAGEYICLMPAMPLLWMIKTVPHANAGTWAPTVQDYVATDWEELTVDPKPIDVQPEAA